MSRAYKPFGPDDETLPGPDWHARFRRACRDDHVDELTVAQLVHTATRGRTRHIRAIRLDELPALRHAYHTHLTHRSTDPEGAA